MKRLLVTCTLCLLILSGCNNTGDNETLTSDPDYTTQTSGACPGSLAITPSIIEIDDLTFSNLKATYSTPDPEEKPDEACVLTISMDIENDTGDTKKINPSLFRLYTINGKPLNTYHYIDKQTSRNELKSVIKNRTKIQGYVSYSVPKVENYQLHYAMVTTDQPKYSFMIKKKAH